MFNICGRHVSIIKLPIAILALVQKGQKDDPVAPFTEAKAGSKMAQNLVFAVPPILVKNYFPNSLILLTCCQGIAILWPIYMFSRDNMLKPRLTTSAILASFKLSQVGFTPLRHFNVCRRLTGGIISGSPHKPYLHRF